MKRLWLCLFPALAGMLVLAPIVWAAGAAARTPGAGDRSPAAPLAHAVSTITGVAISPLLGTGALGAYRWFTAKDEGTRTRLPWYAQPRFWLPALLIVAVCAAKDASGVALPPVLKKPLDALEVVENKFSGLIAAGAVVPFAVDTLWKLTLQDAAANAGAAAAPTGLAMIPMSGVNWTPVLDVLTIPFGIAVFLVVWMASHAINVLILLSPWGAIDTGLKAARTALLGLVTLTATINPWIGALLSVVVIIAAYLVAGWSFRLTVFGTVMSWDFLTRRRRRFVPAGNANRLFSSSALRDVPVRTYGRLVRREGGLDFVYRPWLVRPTHTVPVTEPAAAIGVGVGLFYSIVTVDGERTLFLLPPRYRGHENTVADRYGFGAGVHPAGLRKAWGSLKSLIGVRSGPVAT